jgi:hypothetical protein
MILYYAASSWLAFGSAISFTYGSPAAGAVLAALSLGTFLLGERLRYRAGDE